MAQTLRRYIPLIAASACLIPALAVGGPAAGDASAFRGGALLTGAYAEEITTPLALEWRYTANYFGYNPAAPAVAGDTLFFSSGNRVYALDAVSGQIKWRYPADSPMQTSVTAAPVVADGTVFIGAQNGEMIALNAATGKQEWKFNTRFTVASPAAVMDGVVYFAAGDGTLWALDTKTGSPIPSWKNGFKAADEVSGPPAISGGIAYALSLDQTLHAIQIASGKERWNKRVSSTVQGMTPIISGDAIYVANGPFVTALMKNTGAERWSRSLLNDISANPAISDSAIYVVTSDNKVHALDHRFGKELWKNNPELEFDVVAAPTIAGKTLLVGTVQGMLYGIDTQTGAIKWSYMVMPSSTSDTLIAEHTNIAAPPVVANKTVYILSDDGSVSAFRNDSPDNTGPIVSDTEPEMGVVINGSPPLKFTAKVVDEGSGLDLNALKLMIDNNGIPRRPEDKDATINANAKAKIGFRWDKMDSTLEYNIEEADTPGRVMGLPDGRHTVTVVASDWKGNVTSKSWGFTVDNSLVKVTARKKSDQNAGFGQAGNRGSGGPTSGGFGGNRGSGRGGGGNRGSGPGGGAGGGRRGGGGGGSGGGGSG